MVCRNREFGRDHSRITIYVHGEQTVVELLDLLEWLHLNCDVALKLCYGHKYGYYSTSCQRSPRPESLACNVLGDYVEYDCPHGSRLCDDGVAVAYGTWVLWGADEGEGQCGAGGGMEE